MPPRRLGILGITGSPGTGKKTIAPLVAKELGAACQSINDIAKSEGLLRVKKGVADVDTELLRKALASHLKSPSVVYGHLLPYCLDRRTASRVVVLRCEPSVLKQRLESRGYPQAKVLENVEAELIGEISADTFRVFGRAKTAELDTTYTAPKEAAAAVVSIAKRERARSKPVDWMPNYDSGSKLRSLLPPA